MKETYLGVPLLEAKSREMVGRCLRLPMQPLPHDGVGVLSRRRCSKLLLHLKMKITVIKGWPTEIVLFSSIFLLFFLWSSFCALIICTVLVRFPSLSIGSFYASTLLMMAVAQVTEIHASIYHNLIMGYSSKFTFFFKIKNQKIIIKVANVEKAGREIKLQFLKEIQGLIVPQYAKK